MILCTYVLKKSASKMLNVSVLYNLFPLTGVLAGGSDFKK